MDDHRALVMTEVVEEDVGEGVERFTTTDSVATTIVTRARAVTFNLDGFEFVVTIYLGMN